MRLIEFTITSLLLAACSSDNTIPPAKPLPPQEADQTEEPGTPPSEEQPPASAYRNEITRDQDDFVLQSTYATNPALLESLINLWPQKIQVVAPNISDDSAAEDHSIFAEETPTDPAAADTLSLLLDLEECGFSYDGPECLEGQIGTSEIKELVYVHEVPYLFVVTTYSPLSHKVAYFYRLDTTPDNRWISQTAYVFLVTDRVWAHDAARILREQVATLIANISFAPLAIDAAFANGHAAVSGRSLLKNAHWIQQRMSILTPDERADVKTRLGQMLVTKIQKIHDEIRPDIPFRYLEMLDRLIAVETMTTLLQRNLEQDSELAKESAIRLLPTHSTQGRVQELLSMILDQAEPGMLRRALTTLIQTKYVLTQRRDILNLLAYLEYDDDRIIDLAYEAARPIPLTTEYGTNLIKYLIRPGYKELTTVHALELLTPLADPRLKPLMLQHLSHVSTPIRERLFTALEVYAYTGDDLAALDPHWPSLYPDTRRFVAHLADRINTPDAINLLITHLSDDDEATRTAKIAIVSQKALNDGQMSSLASHFSSPYADLRMAVGTTLLRQRSPAALEIIFDYLEHEDLELRAVMIAGIEEQASGADYTIQHIRYAKSPMLDVASTMIRLLENNPEAPATKGLIESMDTPHETLRVRAFASLLSRTLSEEFVTPLARQIRHEESVIRRQSAQLLGQTGSANALVVLTNRLNVEEDSEVLAAINAAIKVLSETEKKKPV